MLQHVLETLADSGVKTLHAILPRIHADREKFMGDGSRWGLKIHIWYGWKLTDELLSTFLDFPSKTATQIVIGPADCLPDPAELRSGGRSQVLVLDHANSSRNWIRISADDSKHFYDTGFIRYLPRVHTNSWIDSSTPAKLLRSQTAILHGEFPLMHTFAQEKAPGIWIGRNANVHPSAKLVPPVYIGTSARIDRDATVGPNAVVSKRDIVGESTIIQNALVGYHTAVGAHLRLNDSVLLGCILHSTTNSTYLRITEPLLADEL